MKPKYCIACDADGKKSRKVKHIIIRDGVEIGLCKKHYEEYLIEEEYGINTNNLQYGDYNSKN